MLDRKRRQRRPGDLRFSALLTRHEILFVIVLVVPSEVRLAGFRSNVPIHNDEKLAGHYQIYACDPPGVILKSCRLSVFDRLSPQLKSLVQRKKSTGRIYSTPSRTLVRDPVA